MINEQKLNKGKVLLAMSGGTDSSVAALLLKEQGYEVIGITFRAYDSIKEDCLQKETGCCSIDSIMEAKHLANSLGFEHYILDARDIFKETVINNFISEYLNGNTPNPCVLCNKIIKWGSIIEEANKLGCYYIATGHFAKIGENNGRYYLIKGKDIKKDQTYFLWNISQNNLKRTLFPLGDYTKPEVREIAAGKGYQKIAKKTESQEICFIPDNDYRRFLKENVENLDTKIGKGNFINSEGEIIGQHKGYPFYTIGQRKGLEIALGYPAYVTKIDSKNNTITLGKRDDLNSKKLEITNINLAKYPGIINEIQVEVKVRYNNVGSTGIIFKENNRYFVKFEQDEEAITPGQSVVCYQDNAMVCGGIIKLCD